MRKMLAIAITGLLALGALVPAALAETATVRVMLPYFSANVIESETTGELYQDFEDVDVTASIYYFQEFHLKQKFPELTVYGTSQDNALAYTDVDGNMYDGVYNTIGQLVNPEVDRAEIYIWMASTYLQFLFGDDGDNDSIVYDFLSEDAYEMLMPAHQNVPSVEGIIATVTPITQVFLNTRSVEMRVRGDVEYGYFTEAVTRESDDGIRLTLTLSEPAESPALTYSEVALFYLDSLGITEICLVNGGSEQIFLVDTLLSVFDQR
ncbi:MAG: hypothetical protein FWG37_04530 [Clostridia bacterium]|nr:hypothetical protein [Clostridia bacterium]